MFEPPEQVEGILAILELLGRRDPVKSELDFASVEIKLMTD